MISVGSQCRSLHHTFTLFKKLLFYSPPPYNATNVPLIAVKYSQEISFKRGQIYKCLIFFDCSLLLYKISLRSHFLHFHSLYNSLSPLALSVSFDRQICRHCLRITTSFDSQLTVNSQSQGSLHYINGKLDSFFPRNKTLSLRHCNRQLSIKTSNHVFPKPLGDI